jgi:DNA repair protein RecN (Recombination protein N)
LRLVLSDAPDTIVFDEVDAGIGGAAAVAVAAALAEIARHHQVLVVTHLAQVAARADAHIVIDKKVVDGTSVAAPRLVTGDERVAEIARMLSGDGALESALDHARGLVHRIDAQRPAVGGSASK